MAAILEWKESYFSFEVLAVVLNHIEDDVIDEAGHYKGKGLAVSAVDLVWNYKAVSILTFVVSLESLDQFVLSFHYETLLGYFKSLYQSQW